MAKEKFNVTGDQYYQIDGLFWELKRQLRQKSGCPFDPNDLIENLKCNVEGIFIEKQKRLGRKSFKVISQTSHLRLISENVDINLESSDGSRFICEAHSTFRSYIDLEFVNYSLNQKGKSTVKTPVSVYELTKDGTGKEIFQSFNVGLNKLVMTQNQIIDFCEKHPSWLRQKGYATLFLIKENNRYFVVRADVYPDGLRSRVRRFEDVFNWDAKYQHRIVVPQLLES